MEYFMEKKVLITGISGGIGEALLQTFINDGYFVIGQYCNGYEKISAYEKKYSLNARFYQCDFNNPPQVVEFARKILSSYGFIDCLINNAGITFKGCIQDTDDSSIDKILNVNLRAPIVLSREIIKPMLSEKRGCIINVSSIWGVYGGSCEVVYSASKGGLISFTKALSREVGLSSVRVNCISCGFIDTSMNSDLSKDEKDDFISALSLPRLGKPEDVASLALFLSSDASSYITGQIIGVDGGY